MDFSVYRIYVLFIEFDFGTKKLDMFYVLNECFGFEVVFVYGFKKHLLQIAMEFIN